MAHPPPDRLFSLAKPPLGDINKARSPRASTQKFIGTPGGKIDLCIAHVQGLNACAVGKIPNHQGTLGMSALGPIH